MLTPPPGRTAEDILSRTVRITLGAQSYELSVRSIRKNREWKERLADATAVLLANLTESADRAAVVAALEGHEDDLIDALVDYDSSGVLSRELIEDIEPDATLQLLIACREVWRAASPLVVTATTMFLGAETSPSSPPTSSPRPRTAGRRRSSRKN